jgi:hypothetical protein
MTIRILVLVSWLAVGCGDNRTGAPVDAQLDFEAGVDASLAGMLFGEPCTQPAFPTVGVCHNGEGGCHDEPPAGSVCRPFCHVNGQPQCAARDGNEVITDRGACVCVPN